MDCTRLHFSRHAFERMFQRAIDPDAVAQLVSSGELIADYPDDQPFPSALILGFNGSQAVHAVIARDPLNGDCYVVTIYRPDPAIWDEAFRKRRT